MGAQTNNMSNNDNISSSARSADSTVDEELVKLRLEDILSAKGNKYCADCPAKKPLWASFLLSDENSISDVDITGKLAVLVCTECAQHHLFELGEKRCHIKYLKYSHELKLGDLDVLEISGNKLVNKYYEANLNQASKNSDFDKDLVLSDEDEEGKRRSKFIKHKYKKVKFRDHSGLAKAIEKVAKKQRIKDMTVQKAMEDASEKSISSSRRGGGGESEEDATPAANSAKENSSNDNKNGAEAIVSKSDNDNKGADEKADDAAEKKEEEDAKKPEELNDLEKLKNGLLSVKDRRQRALAASTGSTSTRKDAVSQSPRRRDRARSPASGKKMPLIGRGRVKSENAAASSRRSESKEKFPQNSPRSKTEGSSSSSKKSKGMHLSSPNIGGGFKKAMGKVTGATKKALGRGGRKSRESSPKREDSSGVRRALRRPSSFSGTSTSGDLLTLQKEFSRSDFAASNMMPGVQGQLRLSGNAPARLSGNAPADGSDTGLQGLDELSSHLTGLALSKSLTGASAHGTSGERADSKLRSSTGTMGSKQPPAKEDASLLDASSGGTDKSSTGDAYIDGCNSALDNLMSKSLGSRSKPSTRDAAALNKSFAGFGARSSAGAMGAPKLDFLDDDLEGCVKIFDDAPILKDSLRASAGSKKQPRSRKNEAAFHNSFAIDGAAGTRIKQSSKKNRSKSPTRKKEKSEDKSGQDNSDSFGDANPFMVLTATSIPGFEARKTKNDPGKGKKPLRRRSSFGDVDSLKNMGSLGILALDEKKKTTKSRKDGGGSVNSSTRSSTDVSLSPRRKKSDESRSTKKNGMRKLHSMNDAESGAMFKDIGSILAETPKSKSRPESLKSSTRSRTGSSNKKSDSPKKSDKTRTPSTRKKKPALRRNSSLNDLKASVNGDTFKMNARMNMSFALSS